jgi:Coenzyme PQQ synthesis protein D (PqqD)
MDIHYEPPAHVLARSVGDDTVLLDLQQDEYFSLDRVGTRVWSLISAGNSLGKIVSRITDEYGVDGDRVETDVRALVDELVASGLLLEKV